MIYLMEIWTSSSLTPFDLTRLDMLVLSKVGAPGPRKSLVHVQFWKKIVRFLKNKNKMEREVTPSDLGDVFLTGLYKW